MHVPALVQVLAPNPGPPPPRVESVATAPQVLSQVPSQRSLEPRLVSERISYIPLSASRVTTAAAFAAAGTAATGQSCQAPATSIQTAPSLPRAVSPVAPLRSAQTSLISTGPAPVASLLVPAGPAAAAGPATPSKVPVTVEVEVKQKRVEVEVVQKLESWQALQPASVTLSAARVIPGTGLAAMEKPSVSMSSARSPAVGAIEITALPTTLLDAVKSPEVQLPPAGGYPAAPERGSTGDRPWTPCAPIDAASPNSPHSLRQLPEAVAPASHANSPASPATTVPLVVVAEGGVFAGFPTASEIGGSAPSDTGSLVGGSGGGSAAGGGAEARSRERQIPIVAMPVISKPRVAAFSQDACGVNVTLSEDNLTAARRCGCRASAVMGSEALPRQSRGLFFEVVIQQVLEGWMGGLGIGVTHTPPGQLTRLPDKAWRVPESFVVGYSGSAYFNEKEQRISWQPDTLQVGQRVGFLITGDGREHLLIFVDDKEVLRIDGGDLHAQGLRDAPLYPLVDVFNAAQAIGLNPCAQAPSAFGQ